MPVKKYETKARDVKTRGMNYLRIQVTCTTSCRTRSRNWEESIDHIYTERYTGTIDVSSTRWIAERIVIRNITQHLGIEITRVAIFPDHTRSYITTRLPRSESLPIIDHTRECVKRENREIRGRGCLSIAEDTLNLYLVFRFSATLKVCARYVRFASLLQNGKVNPRDRRRAGARDDAKCTARRLATKCRPWLAKGRSDGRGALLARAIPTTRACP